jgi:hypothetical protein
MDRVYFSQHFDILFVTFSAIWNLIYNNICTLVRSTPRHKHLGAVTTSGATWSKSMTSQQSSLPVASSGQRRWSRARANGWVSPLELAHRGLPKSGSSATNGRCFMADNEAGWRCKHVNVTATLHSMIGQCEYTRRLRSSPGARRAWWRGLGSSQWTVAFDDRWRNDDAIRRNPSSPVNARWRGGC